MLSIVDSSVIKAELGGLRSVDKRLYLIFEGSYETKFLKPGVSFSLSDDCDNQELDLLMDLTGILGAGWLSQLCGKAVRLIVYVEEVNRTTYRLSLEAIGHPTEDLYLVLNSGLPLCSGDEAMKYIRQNLQGTPKEN